MPGRPPRTLATEAMVLRRRYLNDADAILTLLAPAHGRIEAVVKGVRKPQSKMRGHVEPVTRSRFLLAHGQSLEVVTQAETIEPFLNLKASLDHLAAALYLCEVAERIIVAGTPHPELYRLLLLTLHALDAGESPQLTVRWAEWHILGVSGFELQLAACASCGADLPEEEGFFAPAAGGLLCRQCRSDVSGRMVSLRAQKVLRFARRAPIDQFAALRADAATLEECAAVLADALHIAFDIEPRSRRFLETLAPGEP